MSYTFQNLVMDVVSRAGKLENPAGITLMGAANSILSMVGKKLLDRRSDLLATNELSLSIPAQGCQATLPTGFLAMAEKPWSMEVYTDWILATVTSYDDTVGTLVVEVVESLGSDALADWNIATVPVPGGTSNNIGSSTTTTDLSVVTAGVSLTFAATPGMGLDASDPIYILPAALPDNLSPYPNSGRRTLQPNYLGDDEDQQHDLSWWGWYGLYGWEWEPPARRPKYYKIVGTILYVRPIAILPINVYGFYFGLPSVISVNSSVIPFNGLFDEVFREGVIRILQKGISIPEADPDFMAFMAREFDSVMNARMHIIPKTRTSRTNFM